MPWRHLSIIKLKVLLLSSVKSLNFLPAPLLKILKEGKSRALFLPCCGPVAALLLNNSTLSAKFSSDFFSGSTFGQEKGPKTFFSQHV